MIAWKRLSIDNMSSPMMKNKELDGKAVRVLENKPGESGRMFWYLKKNKPPVDHIFDRVQYEVEIAYPNIARLIQFSHIEKRIDRSGEYWVALFSVDDNRREPIEYNILPEVYDIRYQEISDRD